MPVDAERAGGIATGDIRARSYTVDMHCHVMVPSIEKLVADRPQKLAEPEMQLRLIGARSVEHNRRHVLPAAALKMVNLALRLADMDRMGVDLQVISPSPGQYYYWADYALAREMVRNQNEEIADVCRQHPRRLLGLGNVALQHPELAVEQLEYAVKELGLKGVEISSSVNGREIADPSLEGFWAAVQSLGCVVFIHPFGTSLGERVNRFYLQNMIGQPLETTIALSNLIFGGVLDRHPGVKILAAHGGGYLPTYIGRSNHGYRVRPEAQEIQHPPMEYLRRTWFDDLVYEPAGLRHLIDAVGVSQVVVGTDYPFDMGQYGIHDLLESVSGLSKFDRAQILGGNALRLLGRGERGSGENAAGTRA
ncbi:MAG TPA: amidohydrolase family protein [Steroidobacteraceae bacterium]|nr:amidohydrolase family protein [Steroidobacteraceae bacterium]